MDRFRLSGLLMTSLVHGAVVVSLVAFSQWRQGDDGPKIGQMVTIEASLAYKSSGGKSKQPQKPRKPRTPTQPTPATNPVSRDETQAPVEPKPDEQPKPDEEEDFSKQFEKFRDERQDEEEESEGEAGEGEPTGRTGGAFDGSEHGFAEVNKGDPYLRELAAQAHRFWSVPTLEQGSGQAVGCVQLGANGRIVKGELGRDLDLPGPRPAQNATIDAAVKRALKQLTELRESEAKPVPAHLMEATTQWICFNFPY